MWRPRHRCRPSRDGRLRDGRAAHAGGAARRAGPAVHPRLAGDRVPGAADRRLDRRLPRRAVGADPADLRARLLHRVPLAARARTGSASPRSLSAPSRWRSIAIVLRVPAGAADGAVHHRVRPARAAADPGLAVDLMAAVPGIVYGLWGFFLIQPHATAASPAGSASTSAGSRSSTSAPTPTTRLGPGARYPSYAAPRSSPALAVAMMVLPDGLRGDARGVLRRRRSGRRRPRSRSAPPAGAMIRTVVLPFGRGGIIGGTMLGLGPRARRDHRGDADHLAGLRDQAARPRDRHHHGSARSSPAASARPAPSQLSALLAAGFVLFIITLSSTPRGRSSSTAAARGAGTEPDDRCPARPSVATPATLLPTYDDRPRRRPCPRGPAPSARLEHRDGRFTARRRRWRLRSALTWLVYFQRCSRSRARPGFLVVWFVARRRVLRRR